MKPLKCWKRKTHQERGSYITLAEEDRFRFEREFLGKQRDHLELFGAQFGMIMTLFSFPDPLTSQHSGANLESLNESANSRLVTNSWHIQKDFKQKLVFLIVFAIVKVTSVGLNLGPNFPWWNHEGI